MLPSNEAELQKALDIYSQIMDDAIAAGGTVSAEHGIGKLKIRYFEKQYGAAAIAEMKAVKKLLDPQWIFNRGTLFSHP
jgi:D-lactate dehydrogenase (cytochrome)